MEELRDLFDAMNDKPIVYHRVYAKITGKITSGLLLSQLVYWAKTMKYEEFYKTDNDFCEELGLSLEELKTAKARIKPFVSITRKGIPAKTYYKVDIEALLKAITSYGDSQQLDVGKPNNYPNTENTTQKVCVLSEIQKPRPSDLERMKEIETATDYEPDGFSPRDRLAMKRRVERSLGLKRANKWTDLLFGSAWDFRTAFQKYEGYEYPDPILLDEVSKTLARWYELGETRDSIRDMLMAFFEGKKHEKVTITPNSVFSSHTYNSWKQNKL